MRITDYVFAKIEKSRRNTRIFVIATDRGILPALYLFSDNKLKSGTVDVFDIE